LRNLSWSMFNSALKDWKGVVNEDGNNEECNEENKRFIFVNFDSIRDFVTEKANELQERIRAELKN
jgi:hypothetical protein